MEIFISLTKAAEILGIAKSTAGCLVRLGKLDAIRDVLQKPPGRLLISRSSIEIFMKQRFKKGGKNGKKI